MELKIISSKMTEKKYFNKINSNLKRIIFEYLFPLQLIHEIIKVSKSIKRALLDSKIFKVLKKNFKKNIRFDCSFSKKRLNEIEINLVDYKLDESLFIEICTFILLIENESFEEIKIEDFDEDPRVMKIFLEFFKRNKTIQKIDLQNNYVGFRLIDKNIIYLSEALGQNSIIRDLNLKYNYLGSSENSLNHLSKGLFLNNSILKLNLGENDLGIYIDNMKYLSEALINNHVLEELILLCNYLGTDEANIKNLCKILIYNKSIKILDLSMNEIGMNMENMRLLSDAIKQNFTLKELNMNSNSLGLYSDNVKHLCQILIRSYNFK